MLEMAQGASLGILQVMEKGSRSQYFNRVFQAKSFEGSGAVNIFNGIGKVISIVIPFMCTGK